MVVGTQDLGVICLLLGLDYYAPTYEGFVMKDLESFRNSNCCQVFTSLGEVSENIRFSVGDLLN